MAWRPGEHACGFAPERSSTHGGLSARTALAAYRSGVRGTERATATSSAGRFGHAGPPVRVPRGPGWLADPGLC